MAAESVKPDYRSGLSRFGPLLVSPGIDRFGLVPGPVTGRKLGFTGPSQFRKLLVRYLFGPINFLFFNKSIRL